MAARGEHKAPVIDYAECYARLGLDPNMEHEPSVVNRAFRTAVAQSPEGRDGKATGVCTCLSSKVHTLLHYFYFVQFKELQEAFNHIMAHLNDLEEAQLYRLAHYEAIVFKV